jgi:WD40 repeat protein
VRAPCNYALTGKLDGTAMLWGAATGTEVRTLSGHSSTVLSVAFSAAGKYIVTGSVDKTAKVWGTDVRCEPPWVALVGCAFGDSRGAEEKPLGL